ncbi:MAG: rod shape-determining protein MreC [Candidatus Omnitrophica bacterium]|nr:rod shape-determining protein MreC [Candidatus Omnitrophota bacterium]
MLNKPRTIALVLLVFWVLVVLNLPIKTTTQLKIAIGGFFLPLIGLANAGHAAYQKAANAVIPRSTLLSQIDQLRHDNQELRLQALQGNEAMRENGRLRGLLGMKQDSTWRLKLARVVGRDPANWWRTILINRGSRDGIKPNLPVLTADGLVGRTSEVGADCSQVILVGDPNCLVAASIQETRDTTGIIVPSASDVLDTSRVVLTYISRTSPVKPGQRIVTSGQGGIFPRGIPIGQIERTYSAEYGQYLEAQVKLAANLNGLEEVWILLP